MPGATSTRIEASAMLGALGAGAPVGLAFWDRDLRYRWVNRRWADMHGLPAGELLGRRASELFGEPGLAVEAAVRRILARAGPIVDAELTGWPAPLGTAHWLASYYPVHEEGEVAGVGGVLVDVTAQREAQARAEILAEASTVISSSVDVESVLEALVTSVVPRLADSCTIHRAREIPESLDCSARSLVLPLRVRGAALGAMSMARGPERTAFTPESIELAKAVAHQAALRLDNARLYREARTVADALQRRLLPTSLPTIPGVDVAATYRAADPHNAVGGDVYDLFSDDDGTWTFLVGDVVGSGPDAAAVTALVRHTLQAGNMEGRSPAECVRLANEALLRRTEDELFCTVVFGQLRTAGGRASIRLVRAGHPPPLVMRADGRLDSLGDGGPLLGIASDPVFKETHLELRPGELLLLYTDGAYELREGDHLDESARLKDAVARSAGATALEVVERIEHEALMISRGEPADDIALLALRVTGDPLRCSLPSSRHRTVADAHAVNEAIAAAQGRVDDFRVVRFVCECVRPHCERVIPLTIDEYRSARAGADRYVVLPSHAELAVEAIVESHRSHVVVQRDST